MRHTVEIADSKGKTMQLSVSVETLGFGGSWRALDKGFIRHNSGPINQSKDSDGFTLNVQIVADGHWGINLLEFISWGTVNDQGTGTLEQAWAVSLAPGPIEWSIV